MSRWVVPAGASAAASDGKPDGPIARVVKYVPAEVVAVFTMVVAALETANIQPPPFSAQQLAAGSIALFFVVTVIYIWQQVPKALARGAHLWITPLAFLVWAYPISGKMLGDWYVPAIAFIGQAVILAISVLIPPKA
ncbi:MAG: hypothetical protein AB1942_17120 [Pseudomonadota bacterium]